MLSHTSAVFIGTVHKLKTVYMHARMNVNMYVCKYKTKSQAGSWIVLV